MANNVTSFSRFTATPAVISQYGWTAEEAQSTTGKPDPNPVLSPMPSPAVAEAKLALAPRGSDQMRLGRPATPEANPYEGPKPTLVLSRNAVRKLGGGVVGELQRMVESGVVRDGNLRALMNDSLRRVVGLRDFMGQINQLTEGVYVRSIAASKG